MKTKTKNLVRIFAYALILFACATPQDLIDRAVKKDPSILQGRIDTFQIVTTRIDSIPYEVAGEIRYRDTLITEYRDTVVNCDLIEIERKKTRFEIRKNFQLEKHAQDLQFKLDKLEKRNERLETRVNGRNTRKATKQYHKTKRVITRQENKGKGGFWAWLMFFLGAVSVCVIVFVLWKFNFVEITLFKRSNNGGGNISNERTS